MSVLTRYLFADILRPAAGTLAALLTMIWLMQSLRFLDLMVNKGLDVFTFFQLTGCLVPSLLIVIVPIALMIGTVFSCKRLFDDNEMSSLMNLGLTRLHLVRSAFLNALVAVTIGYALSLWLIPAGMTSFKQLQHDLRNEKGTMLLEAGHFNQMGDDMMVYLKKRTGPQSFQQLLVHDTRRPDRPVTWMAQKGSIFLNNQGNPHLKLTNGIRQEVSEKQVSMLEFREHDLDILQRFNAPPTHWRDAEERYLHELFHPQEELSPKQKQRFEGEVHRRLLWPLLPIPLVLIACATMLKTPTRRLNSLSLSVRALSYGLLYIAVALVLHNIAKEGNTIALFGQWGLPFLTSGLCLLKLKERS